MATIDQWNERYRRGEHVSDSPSALLVEVAEGLPPGRALDLACGPGRNALWLARRGWDVAAVDASEVAIEILRAADPRIDARMLDLETEAVPFGEATFDLICILHFLHRPLFGDARRLVRPGGIVVTAIHTVRSPMNRRHALGIGELRSYFDSWELLVDREDETAEIAARRPRDGAG